MRVLPFADPGEPDLRSPGRFLVWVGRGQVRTLVGGMAFGVVWMVAMALTPAAVGEAIDSGIRPHDLHRLVDWLGVIAGLVAVQAAASVVRHRFAVTNWMLAAFRSAQLLGEHVARAPRPVTDRIPAGDVVNTLGSDVMRIGQAFDNSARFMGSVVSWLVVAGLMLRVSLELGLVVLLGVPVLVVAVTPMIRPLYRRQRAVRDATGELSALGADTVAGLRILRGVGGEEVFLDRYRRRSAEVLRTGQHAAWPQATLDAAQVALPAVFIVAVTWLGARLALEHRISLGQLVAFYGFSVFLVAPLSVATEFLQGVTRAEVGADRLLRVLDVPAPHPGGSAGGPPPGSGLADPDSGVTVTGGVLTALVSPDPELTATVAERLGGLRPSSASFGGVPLADLPREERRRRIVVSESEPRLFSGPLDDELTVRSAGGSDHRTVRSALEVASATDIVDSHPDGLRAELSERGRSLSGGQRQRLALARALLTEAEVLILVEPTGAVDAHSERRIAERVAAHRRGRTTVVTTSSPLVLDVTDEVVFVAPGRAPVSGTHASLLADEPAYRDTVLRGESP